MRKKLLSLLLMCSLSAALVLSTASAADTPYHIPVTIDRKTVPFSDTTGFPYIDENGVVLAPLRVVLETYGGTVQWNAERNAAVIQKDNTVVEVPIGERYIRVNGMAVALDAPTAIHDGRIYAPVYTILEALGAAVTWENDALTVTTPISDFFQSMEIDDQGELIFRLRDGRMISVGKVTGEDGKRGRDGADGKDGKNGKDGVSVIDAEIDADGDLIFTLSNDRTINAGNIAGQSASIDTLENYDIGDRFYLQQPDGAFDVELLVEDAPVTVHFDSIYAELTAKNDFRDDAAWSEYKDYRNYIPYEVTVHISGQTDPALSGVKISITLWELASGSSPVYSAEIDASGNFEVVYTQGADGKNPWHLAPYLYLRQVSI